MKQARLVVYALLPLVVAASLWAQTPTKELSDKVAEHVRKIDQAEAAAVLAGDLPGIDKYWSDDFTVNAPNNEVVKGKQEVVKMVKAGILDYEAFDRAVDAVLVHGETVIIMGEETVKPRNKAPFAGQTLHRRITNIWMKRDGDWQLTARQATIIERE